MSNLKQDDTGEDYPEAAEKHLHDSRALIEKNRFDGAAYLAGYVVECSLKTIIQKETGFGSVPFKHDLSDLKSEVLRLAAMPRSKTAKYASRRYWNRSSIYGLVGGGWKETIRYLPAGSISGAEAQEWLKEAGAIFEYIVVKMKRNGEL